MNRNYIELKKKRVKELKSMCKENKIKRFSKLKKKQLVETLFKFLYPNENKVIKIEKKEEIPSPPTPPPTPQPIPPPPPPTPQSTPQKEEIKDNHPLKIKLDVLDILEDIKPVEPKTTTPIKSNKDFEEEYEKILQKNIEKIKEKKEKKEKKKIKKVIIDINDNDYIITINNLIKKIY